MSENEIRVQMVRRSDRKCVIFRWHDPVTGRRGEESSGVPKTNLSLAATKIPEFIEQKKTERPAPEGSWEEFKGRYEREYLATQRKSTRAAWKCASKRFENVIHPQKLVDANDSAISLFRTELRGMVSEATINSYLRTLRVALRWAHRIYPTYEAPAIKVTRADPGGRALLREEFERMLMATDKAVGKKNAVSWRRLLRGLVWSGLRLKQAVRLSWDVDAPIRVENIDGRNPRIVVTKVAHKGNREQKIALCPPMIAILRKTPPAKRRGRVFRPRTSEGVTRSYSTIGLTISKIGRAAGVVTGRRLKRSKGVVTEQPRYATAHDLKRTFVKWLLEMGLSPAEVARMAQHSTFDTTWHSYVPDASLLSSRIRECFARKRKKRLPKKRRSDSGTNPYAP